MDFSFRKSIKNIGLQSPLSLNVQEIASPTFSNMANNNNNQSPFDLMEIQSHDSNKVPLIPSISLPKLLNYRTTDDEIGSKLIGKGQAGRKIFKALPVENIRVKIGTGGGRSPHPLPPSRVGTHHKKSHVLPTTKGIQTDPTPSQPLRSKPIPPILRAPYLTPLKPLSCDQSHDKISSKIRKQNINTKTTNNYNYNSTTNNEFRLNNFLPGGVSPPINNKRKIVEPPRDPVNISVPVDLVDIKSPSSGLWNGLPKTPNFSRNDFHAHIRSAKNMYRKYDVGGSGNYGYNPRQKTSSANILKLSNNRGNNIENYINETSLTERNQGPTKDEFIPTFYDTKGGFCSLPASKEREPDLTLGKKDNPKYFNLDMVINTGHTRNAQSVTSLTVNNSPKIKHTNQAPVFGLSKHPQTLKLKRKPIQEEDKRKSIFENKHFSMPKLERRDEDPLTEIIKNSILKTQTNKDYQTSTTFNPQYNNNNNNNNNNNTNKKSRMFYSPKTIDKGILRMENISPANSQYLATSSSVRSLFPGGQTRKISADMGQIGYHRMTPIYTNTNTNTKYMGGNIYSPDYSGVRIGNDIYNHNRAENRPINNTGRRYVGKVGHIYTRGAPPFNTKSSPITNIHK